jgi:hypothetical protein
MVRGLAFAGLMVVLRLIQGAVINAWPTMSGLISLGLLILFTIGVVAWGVIDGRADANASPDPDRRQDLAMTWLLGGVAAGFLSGLVSSLIAMFYKGLYTGGLLSEITTFAAFVALLVFVPAIIGVAIGRWRIDRQYAKQPVRHHGLAAKEGRDDADVFSAVRADESPTGEIPVQRSAAQTEERTAAVATVEREAPTEAIDTHGRQTQAAPTREYEGHTEAAPTREHEARTEAINTGGSESPTEGIRPDPDATRRGNKPNRD